MDIRNPIASNGGDWQIRFGETWKAQADKLSAKFSHNIEKIEMPAKNLTDVPIVFIKKESLIELLHYLKTENGFEYGFLSDITATDESPNDPRFEIIYQLFCQQKHIRIRVKTKVRENETCPTATVIWPAANWAEREIWDMFGIKFLGHPDLRRILMDPRWEGHPLRKDYPLRGYQVFTTPIPPEEKYLK
ncbi:MAG: NADH-quinone oxidoreductase subunit C [Bdellovibrionota bacterium]